MDYADLLAQIQLAQKVEHTDLRPGDHTAVTGHGVTKVLVVDKVLNDWVYAANSDAGVQLRAGGTLEWRLLYRPKVPLPTDEGARIVAWRIDGQELPKGRVLTRTDVLRTEPWEDPSDYYSEERIQEWSPLPQGLIDGLRKEAVK